MATSNEVTTNLTAVPLSIVFSNPELVKYAPEQVQSVLFSMGERHIPGSRIKTLNVSPCGFDTISENVLDAIRPGAMSVTPSVYSSLLAIASARPKNAPWEWRPPRVGTVGPNITHCFGPVELRDLHRIEMVDGALVCVPPSKFIETKIVNATFQEWWTRNNLHQVVVAAVATGAKKGEQQMTVVAATSKQENADILAILAEVETVLTPIDAGAVGTKSLLYSANGHLDCYYVVRSGGVKRRREDGNGADALQLDEFAPVTMEPEDSDTD